MHVRIQEHVSWYSTIPFGFLCYSTVQDEDICDMNSFLCSDVW